MASNIEREVLKRNAESIAGNIVKAIKTKPIKRRTKKKGDFTGVVNASGALASSVKIKYTETGFQIWANDYIDALIFGRKPTTGGGDGAVLRAITRWIPIKGLTGMNAYAATSNIHKFGTSIWQYHKGKDSGLLSDAINKSVITKMSAELTSAFVKSVTEEVSFELNKMVS